MVLRTNFWSKYILHKICNLNIMCLIIIKIRTSTDSFVVDTCTKVSFVMNISLTLEKTNIFWKFLKEFVTLSETVRWRCQLPAAFGVSIGGYPLLGRKWSNFWGLLWRSPVMLQFAENIGGIVWNKHVSRLWIDIHRQFYMIYNYLSLSWTCVQSVGHG